jgi:hypothetical protein
MEAKTLGAGSDVDARAGCSTNWPLERVLFLMAGTMTLLSALLAAAVSPWFLMLTAFVGLNQLSFVVFGNCPSSWLLRRYAGVQGAIER